MQCDAGHLICIGCSVDPHLHHNKCIICDGYGAYRRNPALEAFLLAGTVPCPFASYGCSADVAYVESDDHRLACAFAPCCCPDRGCPFVGAPAPALVDHVKAAHSGDRRPLVALRYGVELEIEMRVSMRWRGFVGTDRTLFVLSVGEAGQDTAVRVVCVRANTAAAPQFRCRLGVKLRGDDDGEVAVMEFKVRSSAMTGDWAGPDERAYVGLFRHLPMDEVLNITLRLDQVKPATAGALVGNSSSSSISMMQR